LIRNISLS